VQNSTSLLSISIDDDEAGLSLWVQRSVVAESAAGVHLHYTQDCSRETC